MMPAPDLRKRSDEELWDDLHGGSVDSNLYVQAKLILELRNLERQTVASQATATATQSLVVATHELGTFTKTLAWATWVLAILTGLLLVATSFQVYWLVVGK